MSNLRLRALRLESLEVRRLLSVAGDTVDGANLRAALAGGGDAPAGSPAPSLAGDANLDGRVDIFDVATLQTNYGTTSGATWSDGDFNGDGAVDVFDRASLQANFGASAPAASSAAGLPGDANLDGNVDIFDVAIVQTRFGTMAGAAWSDGDFDGNGTVDIFDIGLLQTNYGRTAEDLLPLGVSLAAQYPYRGLVADARYVYMLSTTRTVVRLDANGVLSPGYTFPPGFEATRAMTTSIPGTVLFSAANLATRKYELYKSVDWGLHVGANAPNYDDGHSVLRLGDVDGTEAHQIADVTVLTRGMAEVTLGGAKAIVLVEYNVNTQRSPGAANDQMRLMKSMDNGTTWTELAHWNTQSGLHNLRHGHVVSQNPVTGEIYVGFGDTNSEAGLVAWDGVSAWVNNRSIADYATTPGFHAVANAQRTRIADILYEADTLIITADAVGTSEAGIWRATHDLASYTRVDNTVDQFYKQMMWNATTLNGNYYAVSGLATEGATDRSVYLYASNAPTSHWEIVGRFQYRPGTAGGLARNLFAWRGRLYFSQDHLVTDGTVNTLVLDPGSPFDPQADPVTLWPK